SGDTLTAWAGTGGGKHQVFTLEVESNGDYTFTLKDQLDHPFDGNTEGSKSLDFSSIIQATDKDNDTITLPNGHFTINVGDDIPVATNAYVSGTVEEEALPGGNQELGDPTPDTVTAHGSLSTLVLFGADQPGSFHLNGGAVGGLPVLTSAGQSVYYTVSGDT